MKYGIVKFAMHWGDYGWKTDPAITGVHQDDVASCTPSGSSVGILPSYHDKLAADIDCKKMNDFNPSGYYAVCPIM